MMDEPDRLLDQTTSSLERALLQEGRRYCGPEELRAHTLAALGLAATAGLASGGALAWLAAKTWTTKLLMALSAVTFLAAVPIGLVMLRKETATAAAPAPLPAVAPAPLPQVPAALPPLAEAPATAASVTPSAPTAPARAAVASTSSALRAELAALDAVRSTLADEDSAGALSFLDAYFRTFPRGRLRPEAEVLRIDALAKAGRREAAHRYAQEFLKRYPNNVLTARVQPYAER